MSFGRSCGLGRAAYGAYGAYGAYRGLSSHAGFLPAAYRSAEDWTAALGRHIGRVNLEELYQRLDSAVPRYADYPDDTVKKAVPAPAPPASHRLDVEVFCCACSAQAYASGGGDDGPELYLNEARDLVHRIRLTADASNVQPATGHALVRSYVAADRMDELLSVLDDRLNYGVFLDPLMANVLLDRFLSDGRPDRAATVGGLLMLQEDFSHPISAPLSALAARRYLGSLRPPPEERETPTPVPGEKPAGPAKKKKKEEEVKVRVYFLRNPFFDDHFDLRDPVLIAGKTLAMVGKTAPPSVAAECRLLGEVHYKKWDRVAGLLRDLKSVHADTVRILESAARLPHFRPEEDSARLGETLTRLEKLETNEESSDAVLVEAVEKAVRKHAEEDLDRYRKLYKMWDEKRTADLKEEWAKLEAEKKENEREKRRKILEELDEKIWLVDNEEKAELLIEKNRIKLQARYKGKKKIKSRFNDVYIPPVVKPRRELQ